MSKVNVDDLIHRHLSRDIGSTGYRRVSIELYTGDSLKCTYWIDHFWASADSCCRSLMVLQSPAALRGTVLQINETAEGSGLEIFIKLSTSKRPIHVPEGLSEQHVLGTDFSYQDLLFWYPFSSFPMNQWRLAKAESIDGTVVLEIEAQASHGSNHKRTVSLQPDGSICAHLHEIAGHPSSRRCYRAENWESIGLHSFPKLITLERLNGKYLSAMRLESISFDVELPDSLFCQEFLATSNEERCEILNELVMSLPA